MARSKRRTFTESDVNFAVALAVRDCVSNTLNILLRSGAEPSKEIGKIIMHFANGATETAEAVNEAFKAYDVSEPASMEKTQYLQEIVRGQTK